MSEKTASFSPKFFLVSKKQTLCVTREMILGRKEGDFILEDALLSGKHCLFIPRLLECFIKDLNSTNGVYVNKQKIFPNNEVRLNPGDEVRLGSYEFIFKDNEEEAKKVFAEVEVPVTEDLFKLSDFGSFFSVGIEWRAIYFFCIVSTLSTFIGHLRPEIIFPKNLQFLSSLYSELIWVNGVKSVFLVWAYSLVHAFLIRIVINKSKILKFVSIIPYVVVILYSVNFMDGPVWFIKKYIQDRQSVLETQGTGTAIVELKRITLLNNNLIVAHAKILKEVREEDKKTLEGDFKEIEQKIIKHVEKLKPSLGKR